ncbi:class I SAM-dependent methyltransferase [Jiangella rhizosphaerae]|uniref:Class I SAM-dependent methyltransferase n=1 Tax=Jiangella rhizosphaerae TaxID=2293569 RepID=A0A418KSR0_9ACTN|nr:class I SAM-dependent methyltransferase [Jiangella rhizosphaerae]RIQ28204.1 class I SAM-dependent methyltransferase [Jiangella rhizosphaerae]
MAETHFDDWVAQRYERLWPELFEPAAADPVVELLADLADGGPAPELGTGRIALPLSRRGVEVHGVELSPAMVGRLRAQPGADAVGVTVGDFARTPDHLGVEEYGDLAGQVAVPHHYWVVDGELRTFSSPHRYVWPAELDLMARLAGLTPRDRWSDWHRTPFTGDSRAHVSVWAKPGDQLAGTQ